MESKKVHFVVIEDWRVIHAYKRNFKTMSHFYTHMKALTNIYDMVIKVIDDDFYIFVTRKEQ